MALGKSIKMYLTIFVATTCMYMILYQYHISRQPMPQQEIIKHKDSLSTNGIGGSYTSSSKTSPSSSSSSSSPASSLALLLTSSKSNTVSSASSTSLASNKLPKMLPTPIPSSSMASMESLSSRTSKLFKKVNLFLWSPMSSFLSKSLSVSASASNSPASNITILQRNISLSSPKVSSSLYNKKLSLKSSDSALASDSVTASLQQATVVGDTLNNTVLTSSSTSSSSATSITTTTTTLSTSSTSSTTSTIQSLSTTSVMAASANNQNNNTTLALSSGSLSLATLATLKTKQQQQQQQQQLQHKNNNNNKNRNINNNNSKYSPNKYLDNPSTHSLVANLYTPPLYIITPTYRRPEQLAELTRLGYTLKNVINLLWLVIEDANKTSELVLETLNRIGVPYEYFLAPMPEEYKKTKKAKPRGVSNRNRGLQWLRENATEGVFYFADDDNTYDINIFEQMRFTKKVSMWPVGLVTRYGVSSPIIKNGKIIGFYDGWIGGRKYPVDMAGFAVSVKFLHERPNAKMPFKPGYEEDGFLKSLAPLDNAEIELLANNCTEILTWHTQTKKNTPAEKLNTTKYGETNLLMLDRNLLRT